MPSRAVSERATRTATLARRSARARRDRMLAIIGSPLPKRLGPTGSASRHSSNQHLKSVIDPRTGLIAEKDRCQLQMTRAVTEASFRRRVFVIVPKLFSMVPLLHEPHLGVDGDLK